MGYEDRYRVGIYVSPGYGDSDMISRLLGPTVRAAKGRKLECVVIGPGGVLAVEAWFKQTKPVLHPQSCVTQTERIPMRDIKKRVDPQAFLYFSKDFDGAKEASTLLMEQGIPTLYILSGQGKQKD